MEVNLRQSRNRTEHHIFEAGLASRRNRDRVAVAAEPSCDPQNMDFFNRGLVLAYPLALGLHPPPMRVTRCYGDHDDLPSLCDPVAFHSLNLTSGKRIREII
jgi:hypothetical protein